MIGGQKEAWTVVTPPIREAPLPPSAVEEEGGVGVEVEAVSMKGS